MNRMLVAVCGLACWAALFLSLAAPRASAIGITLLTPNIDFDSDGILDALDNSPGQFNPSQQDDDMDQIGNAGEIFAGMNPSLTDTDGDGSIDLTDSAPLGNGMNAAQFNTPYVVDFAPSYTVQVGQSLIVPFSFTHATGASDGYLQVRFDLGINGPGDDFWYFSDPLTLTAVLTPADMATLGINTPGVYSVTTQGGEFGWSSADSFVIEVVPEPATMVLLTTGGALAMLLRRRRRAF